MIKDTIFFVGNAADNIVSYILYKIDQKFWDIYYGKDPAE